MFPGCQWSNSTEVNLDGVFVGQCEPNAKDSYGESGWKGILMALLGNIVIKYVSKRFISALCSAFKHLTD